MDQNGNKQSGGQKAKSKKSSSRPGPSTGVPKPKPVNNPVNPIPVPTKKKADVTFKKAGPGHKLTDPSTSKGPSPSSHKSAPGPSKPQNPSDEKRQAAMAALARQEKSKPATTSEALIANRQLAYIREQARKEIEAEKKLKQMELETNQGPATSTSERSESVEESNFTMAEKGTLIDPSRYAVSGVFFSCPIVGPDVLSKPEIEESIRQFLHSQPLEEIGVTSCLLIHSCNKGKEKVQSCVSTLCKYIDNIIQNPTEPKFQKIRCNNKAYLEKVANIEGSAEFLSAAEFKKVKQTTDDGQEEEVWEFCPAEGEQSFIAKLTELRDSLKSTSPIKPELDRNLQVLMPVQVTQRRELPPDFFELSGEELRREQQRRSELIERETTLRTKAQRERDEMRDQRLYRYACLRVRFPDGFTLQGTFHALERIGDLYAYVSENLGLLDIEFSLKKSGGETLSNLDQTLAEAKLPPASIVNFKLESDISSSTELNFLKPEVLALVQDPSM